VNAAFGRTALCRRDQFIHREDLMRTIQRIALGAAGALLIGGIVVGAAELADPARPPTPSPTTKPTPAPAWSPTDPDIGRGSPGGTPLRKAT
jgi:hypothetical protein